MLELVRVEEWLPSRRGWRGRPLEDRAALARAFLAKAVLDVPTTRALVERLRTEGLLRLLCGWEGAWAVPSEATFSRATCRGVCMKRCWTGRWRATCQGTRPPLRDASRRRPSPPRQPGRSVSGAEWVVYAKRPFAGPRQVLDYLGRYTHRVAISNHRLLALDNRQNRFRWRDYRHQCRLKTMTLSAEEFIRRFLLHVLPQDFRRIRHFGFLACRHRRQKLALCRRLLDMPPPEPSASSETPPDYRALFEQLTGDCLLQCPACRRGHLFVVG